MKTIPVNLKENSYKIHIASGILDNAGELISNITKAKNVVIVTNSLINKRYGGKLINSLKASDISSHVVTIPAGERNKTLKTVSFIYEKLLNYKIDRGGALIGFGGGVVGDITGLAAATWLRGIDFIQIPTTLLAQVDASVGGKTGVNISRGKNLVGAFHQPKTVIIDISVLKTLPPREYRCGLVEVIKHGIIRDREYFEYLEENIDPIIKQDPEVLEYLVSRSCSIKAEIVTLDERESGLRRILNYGHTVAHAIERLTGYRKYKHGEAVAIGMVTAAFATDEAGVVEPDMINRIIKLLSDFGLPTSLPAEVSHKEIVSTMASDKKVAHGRLNVVLSREIGFAFMDNTIPDHVWLAALKRQSQI